MSVDLLPPYTRSGGHTVDVEPVWVGPRYARTRGMGRWHRVRSGLRFRPGTTTGGREGRTCWNLWCGQAINDAARALEADAPPAGEPACGTCEGQALGAGQDDNPLDVDLLYVPRGILPPAWCPGAGSRGAWLALAATVGQCLVCGHLGALRWYRDNQSLERHRPGPRLIGPCPFHAWDAFRERDGHAVCVSCSEGLLT